MLDENLILKTQESAIMIEGENEFFGATQYEESPDRILIDSSSKAEQRVQMIQQQGLKIHKMLSQDKEIKMNQ